MESAKESAEVASTRIAGWVKRSYGWAVVGVTLMGAFAYMVAGLEKLSKVPKEGIEKVAKEAWKDVVGTKEKELQENCRECARYSKECANVMSTLMKCLKLDDRKDNPQEKEKGGELPPFLPIKLKNEPFIVVPKPRIWIGNSSSISSDFEAVVRSGEPRRAYDCALANDSR